MMSSFWWILLATALYGALHSLLAANFTKQRAAGGLGESGYRKYYRLLFSIQAAVLFLPLLVLVGLLPDRTIYAIPRPWVYLTVLIQGLAGLGILVGVMQTGALRFVGLQQVIENDAAASPQPEKLVVSGLYRWTRHPLYTFSFLLMWLTPIMTWNVLALNLGLSTYMLVGSIFEENKLVQQFGEAYNEYKARTPRLIPGLRLRK